MSVSVYGTAGTGCCVSAAAITEPTSTSTPSSLVDRPQSRLSNRMTCMPASASSLQKSSGHAVIWAVKPMMSSRVGSLGRAEGVVLELDTGCNEEFGAWPQTTVGS